MRQVKVYYKEEEAGLLTQHDDGSFTFCYNEAWVTDEDKPSISLTLPKRIEKYHSKLLFPFFYNLLPEGQNKQTICRHMRIEENDYFSLLIVSARYDTIGAVTVEKINTIL